MIRYFLIFVILGITNFSYSQNNLVPNPSFENINSCPLGKEDISVLQNWLNPTNGTPCIFNSCNFTDGGVPLNALGYQFAKLGNSYAGLFLFGYNSWKEYFQVELLQTLEANKKYQVSFYVSLSDSSKWAIKNIGLYFSNNSFFVNTTTALNFIPQIINSNYITDKTNWTIISGSYQATGGERFITIGNFFDDDLTDTLFVGGPYHSFYYVDDVYVGLDTTVNISENLKVESEKLVVYPNPASDNLIIDYMLTNSGTFELFDVTGKCLITEMLNTSNNQLTLSVKEIPNGMYYYRVTNSKGIINTGKLTIIK